MYEGHICCRRFLVGVVLSLVAVTRVSGHIYVDALFKLPESDEQFASVAYFELAETEWPYGEVLYGRVAYLPSLDLDEIFADETYNTTFRKFDVPDCDDDLGYEQWKESPKFLLVDFGPSPFEASMENVSLAAEKMGVDFVVLVLDKDASWREMFVFWWSHKFPGSQTRELISGGDNSTHRHFFLAVGPTQGQAIFELVKDQRLWNQTNGEFYFGIDDTSTIKGRDSVAGIGFYVAIILLLWRRLGNDANSGRQSSHAYTRFTGEDLCMGEIQASSSSPQDCPVCLETMPEGETVRILPCRHVLHHDCITGWFEQDKFSCPVCKMDLSSHLEEQRRASFEIRRASSSRLAWQLWPFVRRIRSLDVDQLIEDTEDDGHEGDLELTEESPAVIT